MTQIVDVATISRSGRGSRSGHRLAAPSGGDAKGRANFSSDAALARAALHRGTVPSAVARSLLPDALLTTTFRLSEAAIWIAIAIVFTQAQPAAAASVAISWADQAVDEDGFQVERRAAAGGAFEPIAIQGPNVVTYLDNAVPTTGAYCYRVRAFNLAGTSDYTNEGCGTATTTASPVSIMLNGSSYQQSDTMVATVQVRAGVVTPVDVYVMVQAGAALHSLLLDGRLVPGLVPMARSVVLPTVDAPFAFPLAGAPAGEYSWIAAVTAPGTLTPVAPLASTPFTITP